MKKIQWKKLLGEKKTEVPAEKLPFGEMNKKQKLIYLCNMFSVLLHLLASCIGYFFIEAISRHSLSEAYYFMTEKPLVFLYNACLIFLTTLVAYLFRRRVFVRTLIAVLWLALGLINGGLLAVRVTPFTGPDLKLLADAINTMNKYMPMSLVVVVCILVLFLIVGLIVLAIKAPKYRGKLRYCVNVPVLVLAILSFAGTTKLALEKRVLSNYFGNIAFAYQDYGYPYCLTTTIFDTGISCPNGYSKKLIKNIVASQGPKKITLPSEKPNIVFLQLESFFDPELVEFLELSSDPIPEFRRLMKEYSSGYYRVPSIGAGTANTEFESITGMSLRYFGPGEYPYKTVLKENTCESIPYVLKKQGYSTHAIHNNEANFYGRKNVFSRLGFDTFTSEEYMPDISDVTPGTNWVKDHILTDEIIRCLDATEEPDYVYTISVQGHGDYPTEPVLDNPQILVKGAENREKNNYSWEYYVNQLKEMDDFIKELTERLEKYPEPVVLVMYGDHLPTMGLGVEDVKNKYLFQTQYVLWDNMGLEKKDMNLAAYQMGAEVLKRLGIYEGTMVRYHQMRRNTRNYQVDLEALQYDILYGKKYVYGGKNPFARTKMQLGVVPIELETYEPIGTSGYLFHGKNFTDSSRIEVNGEMKETKMLDNQTLLVQDLQLREGDQFAVAQQSNSPTKKVLSRTERVTYKIPVPENPLDGLEVTPAPGIGTEEETAPENPADPEDDSEM